MTRVIDLLNRLSMLGWLVYAILCLGVSLISRVSFVGFFIGFCLSINLAFGANRPLIFVSENLPPYHYLDSFNQPKGVLVDVVNAIERHGDLDIRIEIKPFARGLAQMKHQPNVFMFSLLKTKKREQNFQWIGKIFRTEAFLIGLKGRHELFIMDLNEAKSHVVGTIRGYTSERFLLDAGFSPDFNLSLSVDYQQLWQMLFKHRIDYILTNSITMDKELASINVERNRIEQYLELADFPNELYIATSLQTDVKLVKAIATQLQQVKQKGQYRQIIKQWGLAASLEK